MQGIEQVARVAVGRGAGDGAGRAALVRPLMAQGRWHDTIDGLAWSRAAGG